MTNSLTLRQLDRIIEMAWEDRTPFEAIEYQCHGVKDVREVIEKASSLGLFGKRSD